MTLFIKNKKKDIFLVQVYPNDIIFSATNNSLCREYVKFVQGEFEMSMMEELNYFLGLQIKQLKDGIFICQSKYTKELLKKFDMDQNKPYRTPMSPLIKLNLNEDSKKMEPNLFRGMIGSLLYFTASRPNIMFSICMCVCLQSNPKESHLIAIKRILRYLNGTPNLGLWYPRLDSYYVYRYIDTDYVGSKTNKKSTSGACHFLGHYLIS